MTKILLVEDDKSLREIYGVRLLAEGYDIVSAGDGEEALAMAIKERPQLIVSDVMMPKISGFDMLDILRSTTETKDIKVIMMTALSSEDQRARGEQLGADRYLVKSQVGIEDVVRTVHEVLGDAPVNNAGNPNQMFTNPPARPAPQPANSPQQPATQQPQAPQTPPSAPPQQGSYQPSNQPAAPLPQPTAPFSTPRPAGLGDRIIHPLGNDDNGKPDIAALMDQELQQANAAPTPRPPVPPVPPAPTMPAQPAAPQPPVPQHQQPSSQPEPGPQQQPEQNPGPSPIPTPPPPSAPDPQFMSPDSTPRGAVAFTPPPRDDQSLPPVQPPQQ